MNNAYYPTNLTEKQRQVIEKIVDNQKRKRKQTLREIMNVIIYIVNVAKYLHPHSNYYRMKNRTNRECCNKIIIKYLYCGIVFYN
jgi:hypothetical protein